MTIYALRHSNIAHHILRGVPIRVVAVMHDTSVAIIKKNYSALLADHSMRLQDRRCWSLRRRMMFEPGTRLRPDS